MEILATTFRKKIILEKSFLSILNLSRIEATHFSLKERGSKLIHLK